MAQAQHDRTDRALLAVGTFALFCLQLWASSGIEAPTVVFDENGYLGNARWLAGGSAWDMPLAPTYATGYSLLITPIVAVFHTPQGQWNGVRVVNALLLCSVFPLVTVMLRRVFDVPSRRAMAAGIVAALTPTVVATGVSAVAENLVLPLVIVLVLATWAMVDPDRRTRSRLWFGPVVAVLYAAHPRFTLAVPLALALLVWLGIERRAERAERRVMVGNGALLVVGVVAIRLLDRLVWSARWAHVEKLEGGLRSWADLVTSWHGLSELALTAIGQAWYLVIGSVGLVAVGIVVLLRGTTVRSVPRTEVEQRRRIVAGFTLALAAAVFATSVLFFAQNQFRADHYIYGRHNDSFTPLWVSIAVAYLLDRLGSRRPIALLGAVAAAAAVLSALLIATRDPRDMQSVFSPFAVAAVIRFVAHDPRHLFIRASAWGLVGIGVVTLLVWVSRRDRFPARLQAAALPVLVVGLCGWFSYAGFGVVRGTEDFGTLIYQDWTPVPVIERLGVEELCIDASAVRGRATLSYPWQLPDVDIRSYDAAAGQEPPCTFTIARLDDRARRAAGDRVAVLDQGGLYGVWDGPKGLAMWVRSGPEQRSLDRAGALLPAAFPKALPGSARRARIQLVDPAQRKVTVVAGDRVRVPVRLTHRGAGSPWPDLASYALAGHTRVAAEITPLDPDGVVGARSGGELPRWMLPGDTATVDTEVIAVDQLLAPLPPGTYRVQLGVAQDGQDWFASGGPGGAFTMVVTPRR